MDGFYRTPDGAREIKKDDDGELTYWFDWTDWLGADRIDTQVLALADSPTMELVGSGTIHDGLRVEAKVRGGAIRDRAKLSCKITTVAGEVDERTFYIRVVEK